MIKFLNDTGTLCFVKAASHPLLADAMGSGVSKSQISHNYNENAGKATFVALDIFTFHNLTTPKDDAERAAIKKLPQRIFEFTGAAADNKHAFIVALRTKVAEAKLTHAERLSFDDRASSMNEIVNGNGGIKLHFLTSENEVASFPPLPDAFPSVYHVADFMAHDAKLDVDWRRRRDHDDDEHSGEKPSAEDEALELQDATLKIARDLVELLPSLVNSSKAFRGYLVRYANAPTPEKKDIPLDATFSGVVDRVATLKSNAKPYTNFAQDPSYAEVVREWWRTKLSLTPKVLTFEEQAFVAELKKNAVPSTIKQDPSYSDAVRKWYRDKYGK